MTTKFEDRLLTELNAVLADRALPLVSRRSRRKLSLATTGAALAAAAAAFTVLSGGASPAFAVDKHSDGSVTVQINSLTDAKGLEAALIAAGVPADVTYTPFGMTCRQPRYTPANRQDLVTGVQTERDGSATFIIRQGQLAPGDTLVIETSTGRQVASIGLGYAHGPVAPCVLVDGTPASGSGSRPSTGPERGTASHTG